MFWDTEERVPISMGTKRKVFERAKKRCESCGMPLKMSEAAFHHTKKPTVKSRASTIQLLCPTCHRKYGHKYKTITKSTILGTEKIPRIIRKKVHRHKSPYWNRKPKKRTAKTRKKKRRKSKATRKKTKSKTVKTRRRRSKKR
jgi:hypothetical protein